MIEEKFWAIISIPKNYLNLILKEPKIYLKVFLVFVAPIFMSGFALLILIERNEKEKKIKINQKQAKGMSESFITLGKKINEWFKA